MRIGVDIGGTKIEAACVTADGAVAARRRVAAPPAYPDLIAAVVRLVGELEGAAGPARSIGIGAPGARSPASGRMWKAENTPLEGRPFAEEVAAALGRPVRVANDAQCFALSEAIDGAGAGARVVFGVIVGTGTGGGLVVDGAVLPGANGICGEWGHNPLPWPEGDEAPGPPCTCGRRGCVEAFLSGPALARDHRAATGEDRAADRIAAGAAAGDPGCRASLERYADRMARAFAALIHVVDPEVIVLGGGVSRIGLLYELVPPRVAARVGGGGLATRILPARHGDAGGVRGAAWLWPEDGGDQPSGEASARSLR